MSSIIYFLVFFAPAPFPRDETLKAQYFYGKWNWNYINTTYKGEIEFKVDGTYCSLDSEDITHRGKWKVTTKGLELYGLQGCNYVCVSKGRVRQNHCIMLFITTFLSSNIDWKEMVEMRRKTTPKVRDGKVQRKNRTDRSDLLPERLHIIRERPGRGYKHYVTKEDIEKFIKLIPKWENKSIGLRAIYLDRGFVSRSGWHEPGKIAICAMEKDLTQDWEYDSYEEHKELLERLGVPVTVLDDGYVRLEFTSATMKAYLLLHVFLHELGHHHDRMMTKSQVDAARGEDYAEGYANYFASLIWDEYFKVFPW
jgi:hypothetical protein